MKNYSTISPYNFKEKFYTYYNMAKAKEELTKKSKSVKTAEKEAVAEETVAQKVEVADSDAKKNDEEYSEDQIEFARINMRRQFNDRFNKWAVIEPDNADDDYIKEAQKDLDEEVEKHKHEVFKIADADENNRQIKCAEFLRDWNHDFNSWNKGEWRGLLKFNKVINDLIDELKKDEKKNFCIDYATLIFLYNTMMHPHGTGVESAEKMAKYENYDLEKDGQADTDETDPVTYSGLLERIVEHVKYLGAVDKKLNIMKQRVQLAYAGLRMKFKISTLEEFVQFNDAITKENLPTDEEIAEAAKQ